MVKKGGYDGNKAEIAGLKTSVSRGTIDLDISLGIYLWGTSLLK